MDNRWLSQEVGHRKTGPILDSNSSYRTSGRQHAFHTLAVLTGWLPFEGQHNVRTGLEVSGRYWRHTADREPTCVTGEAGHYSRTLASKAGNHSRHLLLVRKTPLEDALMEIADQEKLAGDGEGVEVAEQRRSPQRVSTGQRCSDVVAPLSPVESPNAKLYHSRWRTTVRACERSVRRESVQWVPPRDRSNHRVRGPITCRTVSRSMHNVCAIVKAVTDDRRGMNARDCQSVALPEACLQAEDELKMQKKGTKSGKSPTLLYGAKAKD